MSPHDQLDPEVVAQLHFLGDDDPGFIAGLVATLEGDCVSAVPDMRAALEQQNYETLRKRAHKLKGAAANLGARYVSETAEQIEKAAEKSEDAPLALLIQQLEDNFAASITALKAEFKL